MLAHDQRHTEWPTAFGKTVVAAYIIGMRAVNARILQHRRQLLGQWRERLTAFLNLPVFNDRDGMLGVEGLEELVRKSAQKALPEMKQAILDSVAKWRHGPLTNDMSLVLVELR